MEEVIDLAADSQFSQFSKKVKQSLEDKLRNHPVVKGNNDKLKSFEDMKKQFAQIGQITEPVVVDKEPDVADSTVVVDPVVEPAVEADPVDNTEE